MLTLVEQLVFSPLSMDEAGHLSAVLLVRVLVFVSPIRTASGMKSRQGCRILLSDTC